MPRSRPLLIHEEPATLSLWQSMLTKTLGRLPYATPHLVGASEMLGDSPDDWSLVVLPATARRDAFARGTSKCDAAADFISQLHKSHPTLPVIVIAEKRHLALHTLAGTIERMVLIESQTDWLELLAEKAWMLVSGASDMKPELDVEIRVKTDRLCTWSMKQHGRITADTFSEKELFIDPVKFAAVSEMQRPRADEDFKIWSDKLRAQCARDAVPRSG